MKLFLGKLLLFIGLFFAVDQVLGIVISNFYAKTKNINLSNVNYGFLNYNNEDVLFFGASEVSHSFISNRIGDRTGLSTYNLACDGCGIYYQYPLLETILQKHTPKVILLSSSQLNEESSGYLTRLYPFYKNNGHVKEVVDYFYPNEYVKLWLQGYVYNSKLIRIFDSRDDNLNGYVPLPQELSKIESTQVSELPTGINYALSKETIKYFNKFVERAISNGAIVYIYVPPQLEKINSEYFDKITSLTEKTGAKLIDFSRDSSLLHRRELFFDKTHVNHDGAEVLTDRFIEILKKDKVY